jgi:hypothetical protein
MGEWIVSAADRQVSELVAKVDQLHARHGDVRKAPSCEVTARRRAIHNFASNVRQLFSTARIPIL